MKKLIALLFVASIGAALVAGCSKASPDDASTPAAGASKIHDKTPKEDGE